LEPLIYLDAKAKFESKYLKSILILTNGNVSEAARLAGKTRVEFYRYLKRNDIDPATFRH